MAEVIDAAQPLIECVKCWVLKALDQFAKDKNRVSGRYAYCKACVRAAGSEWYARNRERERTKRREYSAERRRTRGARVRSGLGSLGGMPAAVRVAQYRARHPERVKDSQRRTNQLHGKKHNKAYRLRYPEIARLKSARWRARAKMTTPAWADKKSIRAIYRFASMLQKSTGERVHVDHIVPLHSRLVCGLHCEANLGIALMTDNISKSNRVWPDMPT